MTQRITAGELSNKLASDRTNYKSMEVAVHLTEDIAQQLQECAMRHCAIFDEAEFFVGYVLASDPLIYGVMRRKFFAMIHMPSPRPDQTIFLFQKASQKFIKRLWTLPNAETMACLSEMTFVDPAWKLMKYWCDAFYSGKFWERIRDQHKIHHLSEHEYLSFNREKFIKAGAKELDPGISQPFDFSKISIKKIVDTKTAILEK